MKRIEMTTEEWAALMPAPIDEKNVCSDDLLGKVFDNGLYVECGRKSTGFIHSVSVYSEFYGNKIEIHPSASFIQTSPGDFTEWASSVISRVTGMDDFGRNEDVMTFVDDESGDDGLVLRVVFRYTDKRGYFLHLCFKYNTRIPSLTM